MTVKIRERTLGAGTRWQVDIIVTWPDGSRARERRNAPVTSRSAALRWGQAREASILGAGRAAWRAAPATDDAPSVPTLADFWPRVVSDHYEANRKKPSTIDAAKAIYRVHLAPALGRRPLDAITAADVARLKGRLAALSAKTVNNVLSVLSRALRCAVAWGVLPAMPCRIEILPTPTPERDWYEVDEYRRLVDAAADRRTLLLVLLGGSAGLRRGEIRALRWTDVDIARRQISVRTALWRAHEGTTKGGRTRIVPMTKELADELHAYRARHGDEERVVGEMSNRQIRNALAGAQRRAGLDAAGGIHVLRHTFCSHLALAGVPAVAIQQLAGHAHLTTTMRYMHLSPANRSEAIATLASFYAGERAQPVSRSRRAAVA